MVKTQEKKATTRNQTPLTEMLNSMAIHDTFWVKGDIQLYRVNVSAWGRRNGRKFSITKQSNGRHLCERIA